jgi:hypothetical protein
MSGLAVIILLGHFWGWATWQGALAALAVEPAISLTAMLMPSRVKFWGNPTIFAAEGESQGQRINRHQSILTSLL